MDVMRRVLFLLVLALFSFLDVNCMFSESRKDEGLQVVSIINDPVFFRIVLSNINHYRAAIELLDMDEPGYQEHLALFRGELVRFERILWEG